MGEIAALVVIATAVLLGQTAVRALLGNAVPIGDEVEYLRRARRADPFGPEPFLRMPLMILFVRVFGRTGSAEPVRRVLDMVSLAVVILTGGAAYLAHGPAAAMGCGCLLALWPDRLILSRHLWPDALLALWYSSVLFLLSWTANVTPASPWLLGVVAAGALLTRIEAVMLLPALSLFPPIKGADSVPGALLALWAPSVAALCVLTLWNARRYKIALPDTTALFNVLVLAEEHRGSARRSTPVDILVESAVKRWEFGTHADRIAAFRSAVASIVSHPLRFARGVGRRMLEMLGPDTFSIERLLDPQIGAYPHLPGSVRSATGRILRYSFPALVALGAGAVITSPSGQLAYLPLFGTFLATCLVLSRTRFRYPHLPCMCFLFVSSMFSRSGPPAIWPMAVVSAIVFVVLLMAPSRAEHQDPVGLASRTG